MTPLTPALPPARGPVRPAAAGLRPLTGPSAAEQFALDHHPVRLCAYYATLVMLFMKVSTINELLHTTIGRSLHLLYIFGPPAILGMLLCGGVPRTLRHRLSWIWVAFAAWMIVTVPFSFWVGSSARAVFSYLRDDLMMMFLLAGTIVSWKECRNAIRCAALGVTVPVLYSLLRGGGDRRAQFIDSGTIGNPNDLAAHLLLFLPFVLFVILRKGTPAIVRIAGACLAFLQLFIILRTGSRGALVATGVAALIFLLRATPRQRIATLILVPAALAAGLAFLPDETFRRLLSFSASEDSVEEALQSSRTREYLLRKSIEYTFQNPLFGVGVGQFSIVEGTLAVQAGMRGSWHVTHNSYTQVSSEAGIPALILFVAGIVCTLIVVNNVSLRARAAGHTEIQLAANWMLTGYAAFYVAVIFLSLAYGFYFPTISGLAIALHYTAEREFRAAAELKAGAKPAPRRSPYPPRRLDRISPNMSS
jgi:hypothetical protein